MKKLFNFRLLVLVGVLIMSVSQMGATWYVKGDFNSWNTNNPFTGSGTTLTCTVNITTAGYYEFKLHDGSSWLSNTGQVHYNITDWPLTNEANCALYAYETGNYTFTFNTSTKKLSISYPSPLKKAYFKNTGSWGTVKVHRFNNPSSTKVNTTWPGIDPDGTETIDGESYYFVYVNGGYIIFNNNNNGSQTGNLSVSSSDGMYVTGSSNTWTLLPPTVSGDWAYLSKQTISLTATPQAFTTTGYTYQWQKHNGSSYTNISGATSATYTKSNCTSSDAGKYRCVITYNNKTAKSCGDAADGHMVKVYTLNGGYTDLDWTSHDINWTSGTRGSVTVSLTVGSSYKFKVYDNVEAWFGSDVNHILGGGTKNKAMWSNNGTNAQIYTGPAGDYTFVIDIANVGTGAVEVVSVTYPIVTHPAAGYVYCEKGSWTGVKLHMWKNNGSDYTAWASDPEIPETTICGTTYGYTPLAITTYDRIKFHNKGNESNQTGDISYSNLASYSCKYNTGSGTSLTAFGTYTISFDGNGKTNGTMSDLTDTIGHNKALTANAFAKTGYNFSHWTADDDVTINSATVSAGEAIADGATLQSVCGDLELTANWSAKQTAVTLKANTSHHGSGTDKSVTATYDSALPEFTATTPATGYHLTGYYTGETDGTLVITAAGVFNANSGIWNRLDGTTLTLWAHYEPNTYAINLDDRSATSAVSPSSVTATYDANSLSASISNPSKSGYTFAGWYLDDDTNTGCGTSQLINTSGTLNASVSPYTDASRNWVNDGGTTVYARWKANASVSAYNFQYGSGTYYSSSWTVVNFGDATDNMRTADFTMPDPSSKKYYVGWGGDFVGSGLGSGGSWSYEYDLSDLRLDPGTEAIGTATGATGKLVIYDNSDKANLYVGFLPSGYGVTYNGSTKAFHATPTTNLYETDVVTISAADLSANAFKVQLATSSSYTDCALSASETAATVGARDEAMTSGAKGRFYIWINSSTSNFALYFKTCNNYFETAGDWSEPSNWSLGNLPTLDDAVFIQKAVNVDIANAKAKSVLIDQYDSNTGKLTVASTGALVVATTIQKKDGDGKTVATEETDIILESDASGTGALVAGSESHDTKATVQFYSLAKNDGSRGYINQYIGIPVDSVSKLAYYGSYLRKFDVYEDNWASFSESKMYGFTAYRIMRSETSEGTYEIGGALNLPGTTSNKETILTLEMYAVNDYDNMFANSWTAPIDVTKFDAEADFVGAKATIYVFNSGAYGEGSGVAYDKNAGAGNWTSMPVKATMAVPEDYDMNVIPSQQAFLVQGKSGEGEHKLKLDYKKLVYDPIAASGANIVPTRAPHRAEANDLEIVRLFMTAESGLGDRVLMYVRNDFSADELDNGWEAYKLPGSAFAPQLCAYSGLGEMSISATNVIEGTVLGFYAGTEDSEYTFTFGYEGDNVWYLNDLEAQQSTLINAASSYNFSAVPGTVAERRFVISHTPIANTPTGIDNSEAVEGTQARKQMINGILYIIRGGQIYSTDGQIVK